MIIFLIVLALVILWVIFAYNRFVSLVNRAKEAWADIDVQLKRRYDLIPNLVNTVKGYAALEQSAFEKVTKARAAAMGATGLADKGQAENMLSQSLKSIFAIAENYPQLRANENFLQLQQELAAIEDKIAYARQFYNDSILSYNNSVGTFPGAFFASLYSKQKREFLQIPQEARTVPKVEF